MTFIQCFQISQASIYFKRYIKRYILLRFYEQKFQQYRKGSLLRDTGCITKG